jgi:selenocysteine lyase/cysteine desulfurase
VDKVRLALANHPNIVVLGHPLESTQVHKIPIISFLVRCGKRFLHHNFVSTVLNDVYGIQSRSGCMCAGPYVIRLFGLDNKRANALSESIHHWTYMKPGFTRLSLVYFMDDAECDFILRAITDLAENAWRLLPQVPHYHTAQMILHDTSKIMSVVVCI